MDAMMAFAGYPGLSGEDQEHLNALASYKPPPAFEDAFKGLSEDAPRDQAELAYSDFLEYYQPPAGYKPPEPQDDLAND